MKTTAIAAAMKTAVATIERGDSRAIPQMPCPDVQPDAIRVPKPTNSPDTTITPKLAGISGEAAPNACKRREQGGGHEADQEREPPTFVAASGEAFAHNAADAGNASGQQHQQHRRKPDQRAADGGRDRREIGHDAILSTFLNAATP